MFKKISLVILATSVTLIIVYITHTRGGGTHFSETPVSKNLPSNPKKYIDKDFGFSFTYPQSWGDVRSSEGNLHGNGNIYCHHPIAALGYSPAEGFDNIPFFNTQLEFSTKETPYFVRMLKFGKKPISLWGVISP